MSLEWLLHDVLTRSIQLWTEGGQLRFRAPGDALTPELRARLRDAKDELLPFFGDAILAPASPVQKRLWFLQRLQPESATYNVAVVLRVSGALDEAAFRDALRRVFARHEALRTSLRTFGGETAQWILPASTFAMPAIDIAAEDVGAWLAADARRPFGEGDSLATATLLRVRGQQHLLAMRIHHGIVDGTAVAVLVRDLERAYASTAELPAAPQYREFVLAEEAAWTQSSRAEATAFWQSHLAGAPAQPSLPYDGAQAGGDVSLVEIFLDGATSRQLRALCRQHTVTPFTIGLTVAQVLIARITGDGDAVIGAAIDTRRGLHDEDMIGCCINTLPLRLAPRDDDSFLALLEKNKQVSIDVLTAGRLPFDAIVQATTPASARTGSPLFSVMFDFPERSAPRAPEAHRGVTMELVTPTPTGAKSDLVFRLSDDGERWYGGLFYARERFAPETAQALASGFRTLLTAVANTPDAPVAALPLLTSDEEQAQLRRGLPEHAAAHGPDALAAFTRCVEQFGDRSAVTDPDGTLTYRELDVRSSRLAARLRSIGVAEGSYVGIRLERGNAMVAAMLAVWKCGAAYVPLDLADPEERARFVCADLGLAALITKNAIDAPVPLVDPDDRDGALADGFRAGGDRIAYVIYTSGSTGAPKGVAVAHGALANLIAWHRRAYRIDEHDRASQIAGVAFDATVWELWPYLASGAAVHFPADEDRQSAAGLARWLARERITMSFVPTPMIPSLLDQPEAMTLALKALLTGGDQLHRRPDASLPYPLINHYGPTENAVVTTAGIVVAQEDGSPSIGRPIDGVSVLILDEQRRPVPAGVAGELYIGGASLARGYANRPELTAQRFVAHPFAPGETLYRTGDRVRFRANNEIEFLGRLDHQVKIRGYRIELGEIEAALERREDVAEAVVVAATHPSGEKRLVAFVIAAPGHAPDADQLSASLGTTLPHYMLPRIVFVDAFPLTVNGKIDRKLLATRAAEAMPREREIDPPRNIKEEKLAEIWMELLGVAPIGRTDDFFELGGHSLLVMQCLSRIKGMFDVDLPAATFYSTSRLVDLVDVIRKLQQSPLLHAASEGTSEAEGPIALQPNGTKPPLFVVHAAGGHLLEYRTLARELAAYGQPVFGLQSPGFDRDVAAPQTLEELASTYLAAVLRQHPQTPYRFGGYCIGGLIAFEMARQARAAGLDVDPVVIFDTRIEGRILNSDAWEHQAAMLFAGELKTVMPPDAHADADAVWNEFARQWSADAERLTRAAFDRLYRTYMANLRIARNYVPARFEGELLAFEPEGRRGKPSGWPPLASAVQRHFTPGKHLTFMREPHARVLARVLDDVVNGTRVAR